MNQPWMLLRKPVCPWRYRNRPHLDHYLGRLPFRVLLQAGDTEFTVVASLLEGLIDLLPVARLDLLRPPGL
jgi:hypothetical protein